MWTVHGSRVSRGTDETDHVAWGQQPSINMLVLVPWPDTKEYAGWDLGLDLLPGSRIAATEINSRNDLLDGYNITIIEAGHDACGLTVHSLGLMNLVNTAIRSRGSIAGVLGLFCSSNTAKLSPIAGRSSVDLIQLSASYSPLFKDQPNKFPHLYRFVPSADVYSRLVIHLADKYQWSRFAIITNTENYFYSGISSSITEAIVESGKEVVYKGSFVKHISSFVSQVISDVIEAKARIIILSAESFQIADLLCEAFQKKGMKYPNYLWFIIDWTLADFLQTNWTSCDSEDQLYSALEGSVLFYMHFIPLNTTSETQIMPNDSTSHVSTASYEKYQNFVKKYWNELENVKNDYKHVIETGNVSVHGNLEYASVLYNQVYGLSLALNSSILELKANNISIENYGYGQSEATSIIERNLKRLSFDGFTGKISFNEYNETTLPILVFQVIDGQDLLMKRVTNISNIDNDGIDLQLNERVGDTVPVLYITISTVFTGILIACMLMSFILVTLLLVLMLKYRHVRRVRASSVKVSILMFIACYLFLIADSTIIIMCSIELTVHVYSSLCNLSYFFFYNASMMLFSAQIFKQERVNIIFSNSSLKIHGWWYSNWMLVVKTISVCLIGDVIWVIVISIKSQRQYFFDDYELQDGITVQLKYPYCYAREDNGLFYGLYTCIGVLLILNMYHATSAKKTMKEDFRVTKFVNFYTIAVFITLSLTVPFKEAFFIDNKHVLYVNVVVFFSILMSATLAQLILFLPLILHAFSLKK